MAKTSLPSAAHDHFRKANLLHTYVQQSLGEATKHALETGRELLKAKESVPHGRWEAECGRLFDGSVRTAQFYMAFARDVGMLKSAEASALLLDSSLDAAAKAARNAARPPAPEPPPVEAEKYEDDEPEEEPEDLFEAGSEAPPPPEEKPPPKITAKEGREKEVWCAREVIKGWADAVGRWMNGNPAGIDVYREKFPGPSGDRVIEAAKEFYNALDAWKRGLK